MVYKLGVRSQTRLFHPSGESGSSRELAVYCLHTHCLVKPLLDLGYHLGVQTPQDWTCVLTQCIFRNSV